MSDKIYIKLTHNADKQAGDNRPSFVAPINPKSPEGKTWRIGVKIGETWYNQAGFDDLDEQGNPTGIINVVLTPSNTGSALLSREDSSRLLHQTSLQKVKDQDITNLTTILI